MLQYSLGTGYASMKMVPDIHDFMVSAFNHPLTSTSSIVT